MTRPAGRNTPWQKRRKSQKEVSRCGATYFFFSEKVGKTPLEPTVQDSLGNVEDFIEPSISFDDSERCLPGVVRRAQRAACSAAQDFWCYAMPATELSSSYVRSLANDVQALLNGRHRGSLSDRSRETHSLTENSFSYGKEQSCQVP